MTVAKKLPVLLSSALLSSAVLTQSPSAHAIDPFVGAALIGGGYALGSSHHHLDHTHLATYPTYRRVVRTSYPVIRTVAPVVTTVSVPTPTYLPTYTYATSARYILRAKPMVKGHSCGWDGICVGH